MKSDLFKVDVTYKGLEYTIEYDWEEANKGNFFESAHDDGVCEYFIYIGEVDVTEMLTQRTQDEIIQLVDDEHRKK